jgi:hypothetical protein
MAAVMRKYSKRLRELQKQEEGSLAMKIKLFLSVLLLVAMVPGVLADANAGETNAHSPRRNLLVTPVEEPSIKEMPTNPAVVANDPKQALVDYDALMIALTQKFSATLAVIAEAAKRGELSSEQAREVSAEQYQLAHMQFELISLWRDVQEQDLARTPDVQARPDPKQEGDVVVVALPFSSFHLNPSLAEYLNLTQSQVTAIQPVMMQEQQNLEPLITELRTTRQKLLAIGSEHASEKELKALAEAEARLLSRLFIANAHMQSKIYRVLSPEQQRQLSDLERTQGTVTPNSK